MFALAYDWERAARRALENDRPESARMYAVAGVGKRQRRCTIQGKNPRESDWTASAIGIWA